MIHKLTVAEEAFTSTGSKLAAYWPIFAKLRETGYGSIIRATMTLHQVCSARCSYCSTSRRNKRDACTLGEAQDFVDKLYSHQALWNEDVFPTWNAAYKKLRGSPIRLQGLILSGGGQPNLWPPFAEFVDWLSRETEIKLGLITNAFPKGIDPDVYANFAWVRLSITPAEASNYPDGDFAKQYVPASLSGGTVPNSPGEPVLGLSYVVGPWTKDEDLVRLDNAAKNWGAEYARVLVDCNLPRSAQLQAHAELGARLVRLGLALPDGTPTSKVFHQLKYHGTPEEASELWDEGQCFLQSYSTFWDTTGHEERGKSWCYPCDSVTVLAEEPSLVTLGKPSERRFEPAWGTVTNDQVHRLYTEPLRPFFDPREQCSACLFMKNNAVAKALRDDEGGAFSGHVAALKHVEFP